MYEERRILNATTLHKLCTKNGWYSKGTYQQYANLMDTLYDGDGVNANLTTEKVFEIASDIHAHSEINCTVDALMSALVKECTTVFEKVITPWNTDISLPENILEKLLFDCEFNPEELEYLSKSEILNAILEYEGIIGYTDKILDWVCEIWNIEL